MVSVRENGPLFILFIFAMFYPNVISSRPGPVRSGKLSRLLSVLFLVCVRTRAVTGDRL